jgi:hypothetical protein
VVSANLLPAAATSARGRDPAPTTRFGRFLRGLSPIARAGEFAAAFQLLLHRAGNAEHGPRRIAYVAEPAPSPLARTFRYGHAARVIDVAREEPRLQRAADEAAAEWRRQTQDAGSRVRRS